MDLEEIGNRYGMPLGRVITAKNSSPYNRHFLYQAKSYGFPKLD